MSGAVLAEWKRGPLYYSTQGMGPGKLRRIPDSTFIFSRRYALHRLSVLKRTGD